MTKRNGNTYSPEVRERAVRMVLEHRGEYASEWEAINSIASKIGCTSLTKSIFLVAGFGSLSSAAKPTATAKRLAAPIHQKHSR